MEIFLSAIFFTLLGTAYVKGYDLVKERATEHLPHFYLAFAIIRMLLVLTVVGIYVWFADNRDDAIRFVIMFIIMYAIMMVVTLSMRH